MKSKYGHQSKTVGYQGKYPDISYLSLNNETIRQGKDSQGHFLQARISPSESFGAPIKQGTFWEKQDTEENLQTREEEKSNPATKVDTTKNIRHK